MNKSDWDNCQSPWLMLNYLRGTRRVRKLRLFACACARQAWEVIEQSDPRLAELVEMAERHADDRATEKQLAEAVQAYPRARRRGSQERWRTSSRQAALACTDPSAWNAAARASEASRALGVALLEEGPEELTPVAARLTGGLQADLLRDLFATLYLAPRRDLSWLGSAEDEVCRLAAGIYQEHTFRDLSILADALEEAGCPDQEMLAHCREPGIHARGCWVVDTLLGKE